jgi:hypothetical protein
LCRLHVHVAADLAGLGNEAQIGQPRQQGGGHVASFPDQHHRFMFDQALRQIILTHGFGEHIHRMAVEQGKTRQVAHGVLIVVEDGDFHRGCFRLVGWGTVSQ